MNRSDPYLPLHCPTESPGPRLLGLSPVVAGTACCVFSAVGYTAANICMRRLTELQCDPMWAVCIKELVAVLVVGPWLLVRGLRGQKVLPPWRALALLMLVGLVIQLGGNLSFQWSLGVVGLAVAIPAIFGVMLTTSAAMGSIFLGERVSRRCAVAIGVLVASLMLLGLSAGAAGRSVSASSTPLVIGAAVAAACLAGALYALLTTTIRHTVTGATRTSAVVLIVTGMGVLSLGPLSIWRLGTQRLLDTSPEQIAWMLAAGAFNLVAFLAITKGLELTTVVHANLLNASQVAMAAIAGMMIFNETLNPWLMLGVGATIVGILLIDRPDHGDLYADRHA